jgi:hypothetical protein
MPPLVSQLGDEPSVNGVPASIPTTALLGLVDLEIYRTQLASVFPVSRDEYPLDSLTAIQRQRASDWITRLSTVSADTRRAAVGGWQSVLFAEIAVRAEQDSVARRIIDARLAELTGDPARQSYVLFAYIGLLADPTQDSARLARNVLVAERYLTKLRGLPSKGYRTRNDSTSVLERKWRATDTLIVAYAELGDTAQVIIHAEGVWSYVMAHGISERSMPLLSPYGHVVKALMQTPVGRARIVALAAPLKALAHRAATEFVSPISDDQRIRAGAIENLVDRTIRETQEWLALLGRPAPALAAHAWLNTSDSGYATPPRSRGFADGRVHVVLFGAFSRNDRTSVLDRLQRSFPSEVEALLVTETQGYTGPDIVTPHAEVAWLTRYLRSVRHFVMPVAIWAGSKIPAGFVPEGHYAVSRPEPTPNEAPYHASMLGMSCVLIDRHGIIRAYQDIHTRRNEIRLRHKIQALLADPDSRSSSP